MAPSKFAPMAHYSIPNLSPASGRISTRSLRPSRKQNKTAARYQALTSTKASAPWLPRFFNAQRPIRTVGHWMFNIGRHAFFAIRRVKGAWWPSRSSKPSLPRKWRGRFDSYPLRHLIFELRVPIAGVGSSNDFYRKSQIAIRKSKIG